jgi:outer membrane protein OmpU
MRKLLLAGTATISLIGAAVAQTPPAPTEMLGIPSQPSTYLGGNNSLNSDGGQLPVSPSAPTPGTMTVHLNGRVWGYFGVQGGSSSVVAGNKVAPDQFVGYFRLYPGVDALATNGLRYGAIVEIRQNYVGQTYGLNITAPPGTSNPGAGSNYSSSASAGSSASTLYVRREALYLGSDQVGILRIGQDDGPFSQFDNGVTTFQFGTGAFNGDAPSNLVGSGIFIFPFFSGVGNEYVPSKAAYFSPRFAGFDLGVSFAPNNAANNATACAVAAAGCPAISTATTGAFGGENRATNWYEVMGRYQGNFGGLGIYGILGYTGSGHVHVWGSNPGGTGGAPVAYNGFSVGDGGLALTYAGFTIGGNVLWGAYNGQVQLKPQGGANAVAWTAGAQYAVGPLTLDAAYLNYQSQGAAAMINKSQSYNTGIAAGVTYAVAPGLNAYAEYLYLQTHQGGVSQITGSTGTSANNDWHGQSFIIGTRVQW